MSTPGTTRPLLLLGAAAVVVTAAVLTRPGPPVVAGLAATPPPDTTAAESDDGAATDVTPAPVPAEEARPASPTGGNYADAPPLTTALEVADLPVLRDAPDLVDLDGWLQADGLDDLDDLRGEVVVVQFWTFSCFNCTATLPNLTALRDAHAERDDFRIVGVHAPEFDFEKDPAAVAAAATDLDVTWPVALDTDKRNFHAWQEGRTAFWPRTYVLDREGRIRFDHIGEGRYAELNETVGALLAEG